MSGQPLCVCGCPHDHHGPLVMSVPLVNPTPAVKILGWAGYSYPHATYERNQCADCGCGDYLADSP